MRSPGIDDGGPGAQSRGSRVQPRGPAILERRDAWPTSLLAPDESLHFAAVVLRREGDSLLAAMARPEFSVVVELQRRLRTPVTPLTVSADELAVLQGLIYQPEEVPAIVLRLAQQWLDRYHEGTRTRREGSEPGVIAGPRQLEAIANVLRLPHVRVERHNVNPSIIGILPPDTRLVQRAIPFFVYRGELLVLTDRVADWEWVSAVRAAVGLAVRPVLCESAHLETLLATTVPSELPAAETAPLELAPLLRHRGLVTDRDLMAAEAVTVQLHEPIEKVLLRLGVVTPQQILETRARHLGVDAARRDQLRVDPVGVTLLPEPLARRLQALPYSSEHNVLSVAMTEPGNKERVELLRLAAGRTVIPELATLEDIERAWEEWHQAGGAGVGSSTGRDARATAAIEHVDDEEEAGERYGDVVVPKGDLLGVLMSSWRVSTEQLTRANLASREQGISTLDALLDLGVIDEEDLATARGLRSALPWVTLVEGAPDVALAAQLPEAFARERQALLLERETALALAACVDDEDATLADDLTRQVGAPVRLSMAPMTSVAAGIEMVYAEATGEGASEEVRRFLAHLTQTEAILSENLPQVWLRLSQGMPLDEALVDARLMSAEAVARAMADYLDLELFDLGYQRRTTAVVDGIGRTVERVQWTDPLDYEVGARLPREWALRLAAVPVIERDGLVVVCCADPFQADLLENLRLYLGPNFTLAVGQRQQVIRAIQRLSGHKSIGDLLLEMGLASEEELRRASDLQSRTGVPFGQALVSLDIISEEQLAEVLAQQLNLPFVRLAGVSLEEETARLIPRLEARRHALLPILRDREGVLVAMADPLDGEGLAIVEQAAGESAHAVVTTRSDIEAALEAIYRDEYADQSSNELLYRYPEESASRVLTGQQKAFVIGLLLAIALALYVDHIATLTVLIGFSTVFYVTFSTYKFYLIYKALSHSLEVETTPEEVAALDERALPVYTILCPLYKETEVLPMLVRAIDNLDYPKAKLDVKILLEEDDVETIEVARATKLPAHFKLVVVPHGQPKGKPKACNYGLIHAEGTYAVIFDAEDLPEPDQLKKAIVAFQKADPAVACIQAKLNYYNREQNMLTRWFTTEYSMWFDLFLPGLDASGAPIPLGGTSNHFITARLLEIGAWDPYNVTEDADLGVRLYKAGWKTAVIESTTYEEANSAVLNWIRQRSRWVKGYIQTYLVHMRHPIALWQAIGTRAFFSFNMVVGGTFFGFLVNPIYWALTALWFLTRWRLIQDLFPGPIFYIGAIGLYIGNFAFAYTNVAGCLRREYYDMVKYALISPLYWSLMSIAAWKGFLQLIYKPFYWEKTVHGLYKGGTPNLMTTATAGQTPR